MIMLMGYAITRHYHHGCYYFLSQARGEKIGTRHSILVSTALLSWNQLAFSVGIGCLREAEIKENAPCLTSIISWISRVPTLFLGGKKYKRLSLCSQVYYEPFYFFFCRRVICRKKNCGEGWRKSKLCSFCVMVSVGNIYLRSCTSNNR